MLGADESIFKNADGTMKSSWQVMLGRDQGHPGRRRRRATASRREAVRRGVDPTPHMAQLNAGAKLFARETSIPTHALAITDMSNPTSAESYDRLARSSSPRPRARRTTGRRRCAARFTTALAIAERPRGDPDHVEDDRREVA
jgi:hypothetical protein